MVTFTLVVVLVVMARWCLPGTRAAPKGGLDEEAPDVPLAGVADVAGVRRPAAGLADDRVQPEIPTSLLGRLKRLMSPMTATSPIAVCSPIPGIEGSRRTRSIVDDRPGEATLGDLDLSGPAIEQRSVRSTSSRSSAGSSTAVSQARPLVPNLSRQGLATRFRMRTALIRLRSLVRSATRAAPAGDPPAERPRLGIGLPDRRK